MPERSTSEGMNRSSIETEICDTVPWAETLTDYDRAHLLHYLRLLDASAAGATTADMARVVLGIDPSRDPERVERAVASHLKRARWMSEGGYASLLGRRKSKTRK